MFWKYIFPAIIVIVATVSYFLLPYINQWVAGHVQGWWGLLWIAIVSVVLWLYFFFALGYRGSTLRYITLVIIFTALCLWLIANFDFFTEFLKMHLGQWGMIGVLLLLIVVFGFALLVLF